MKSLSVLLLILLSACAPQPAALTPLPDAAASLAPATDAPQVAAATATPAPADTIAVKFWLPDELAGLDSVDAGDVLSEQISGFQRANPTIEVELRLRAASGTGGILETLRTGALVAPAALPDITLLRYNDFRVAVELRLLAPLESANLLLTDESYHAAVAAMGIVEEQQYGVASTLDLLHVAYTADEALSSTAFADWLTGGLPLLFPAAPASGLGEVFLLQYWLAGGSRAGRETLGIDEDALRATLRFYERATAADLIPIEVLEYDLPQRYADALGGADPAVITSHMALEALNGDSALRFASIPTQDGEPATILDGWLWVITTSDPERQTAALRLLNWMLLPEREAAYHSAIALLPANRAAQRQIALEYAVFIDTLLQTTLLPLPEYTDSTVARALQNAYVSVISGQSTANDAVEAVLAQFDG
jgi:ABC-type glycerol-3-phosphate transport system substrate-binding protein